jgi:hypothetical protein
MSKKGSYFIGTAVVLVLIGLISFPAIGIAARATQGCSAQGSWFGYSAAGLGEWMATIQGQSQASGTVILESLSFDLTLGGIYPTAVRSTAERGTWESSGPNTFRSAMIAFAVDDNGTTVYIGKIGGTSTFVGDCNTIYIEDTLAVFLPTQNPFADEPLFTIPLQGHYGYRMRID